MKRLKISARVIATGLILGALTLAGCGNVDDRTLGIKSKNDSGPPPDSQAGQEAQVQVDGGGTPAKMWILVSAGIWGTSQTYPQGAALYTVVVYDQDLSAYYETDPLTGQVRYNKGVQPIKTIGACKIEPPPVAPSITPISLGQGAVTLQVGTGPSQVVPLDATKPSEVQYKLTTTSVPPAGTQITVKAALPGGQQVTSSFKIIEAMTITQPQIKDAKGTLAALHTPGSDLDVKWSVPSSQPGLLELYFYNPPQAYLGNHLYCETPFAKGQITAQAQLLEFDGLDYGPQMRLYHREISQKKVGSTVVLTAVVATSEWFQLLGPSNPSWK